ncbi:hypothetical protein [Rubritalea tangerina]|uniref:hypothetical protein n=1 Tax=Rubritalea tangerina TaxID=430798 RepID=UPI0036209A7A
MFYYWEISHTVYCIVLQCLIAWIFYSILLRRWRLESSHLLSKLQCIVIAVLMHAIVLGGIWANTTNGSMFDIDLKANSPEVELAQQTIEENTELIAATVLSLYGIIGFATAILLQYIYTPDKFRYLAGLRERDKRGGHPYALWKDSASGIPTSLIISSITIAGWIIYTEHFTTCTEITQFLDGTPITPVST